MRFRRTPFFARPCSKTILPSLLALLLLAVCLVYAQEPYCSPGEVVYNVTGQYICVPAVNNATIPFGWVRIEYTSETTLLIEARCMLETGCSFEVKLVNSTNDQTVYQVSFSIGGGELKRIEVNLPSRVALIAYVTVNGFAMPVFAVPPYKKPLVDVSVLFNDQRLYIIYMLAVFGPLIGFTLRGSGREAAIALIAGAPLVARAAIALGAPPHTTYMIVGVVSALALLLAAAWKS